MSTKQLNLSGPRNFKEKIELLKQKEAACTASFAAAIRDAREIRQIAGSYDLHTLKTNLAAKVHGGLNHAYNEDTKEANFLTMLSESPTKSGLVSASVNITSAACATTNSFASASKAPVFSATQSSRPTTYVQPYKQDTRLSQGSSDFRPFSSHTDVYSSWRTEHVSRQPNATPRLSYARSMHSVPDYIACDRDPTNCIVPHQPAIRSYISTNSLAPKYDHTVYRQPMQPSRLPVCERRFDGRSVSAHSGPFAGTYANCPAHPFQHPVVPESAVPIQPFSPCHQIPSTGFINPNHAPPSSSSQFTSRPQVRQQPCEFIGPAPPPFCNPHGPYNVDGRRVSSDSSIRRSVITAQLAPTQAPNPYPEPPTYNTQVDPIPHMSTVTKTPYPGPDDHVIPTKRPYTLCAEANVTMAEEKEYMELQSPITTLSSSNASSRVNASHVSRPDESFTGALLASSTSSSCSEFTQKLHTVLSSSAPNINIQTTIAPARRAPNVAPTFQNESYTRGEISSTVGEPDLDRYLQIPGVLLDGDEGCSDWVGRRDSCTMTAEVLSALSANTSGTNTACLVNRMSHAPPPPPPPQRLPCSTAARLNHYASSAFPPSPIGNNMVQHDYTPPPSFAPHPSADAVSAPPTTATCVQVVANQLGISITSNDYQLLTNPHLSNYVTDETTEAQFLR